MDDQARLLSEVKKSIAATIKVQIYIDGRLANGPPFSQEVALNAQKIRADSDLIHFLLIENHLVAAETVIEALDEAVIKTLDNLSAVLDQAIVSSFIINATLGFAKTVLNAAEKINGIAASRSGFSA